MTHPTTTSACAAHLLGTDRALCEVHDVALLDLDGVCFAGASRVPHAAESVEASRRAGMAVTFVTNNASRAPGSVVDKLAANDIGASVSEVFSAAMDGAALLREHLPAGSRVLVIGGRGLREALGEEGFVVVDSAEDQPEAVAQGWDPSVDWAMMSEGAYAIANGALHLATNTDATLPTERGFALGNGSLVTAVANATGRDYLAAGKPFPGIYQRALARGGGQRPVAVGDRLNTDLVGARAAGIPGLHVLTGVNSARDVLLAAPEERPSYLHTDLRGLTQAHPQPIPLCGEGSFWWQVGDERVRVIDGHLEWAGHGQLIPGSADEGVTLTLDAYRAGACALWTYLDAHQQDASAVTVPEIAVTAPESAESA